MFFSEKQPFTQISKGILFPRGLPEEKQEPLARALETLHISPAAGHATRGRHRETEWRLKSEEEEATHSTRFSCSEHCCAKSSSSTRRRRRTPSSHSFSQHAHTHLLRGRPSAAPAAVALAGAVASAAVVAPAATIASLPAAGGAVGKRMQFPAVCSQMEEEEEDLRRRRGRTRRSGKLQDARETPAARSSPWSLPDKRMATTAESHLLLLHRAAIGGEEEGTTTAAAGQTAAGQGAAGQAAAGLLRLTRGQRRTKQLSLFSRGDNVCIAAAAAAAAGGEGQEEREGATATANSEEKYVATAAMTQDHRSSSLEYAKRLRCLNSFSSQETVPSSSEIKEDFAPARAADQTATCEDSSTTGRSSTGRSSTGRSTVGCNSMDCSSTDCSSSSAKCGSQADAAENIYYDDVSSYSRRMTKGGMPAIKSRRSFAADARSHAWSSSNSSDSFCGRSAAAEAGEKEGDEEGAGAGVAAVRRGGGIALPGSEGQAAAQEDEPKSRQLGGIAGLLVSFISAARSSIMKQQQQQRSESPVAGNVFAIPHVEQQKQNQLQEQQPTAGKQQQQACWQHQRRQCEQQQQSYHWQQQQQPCQWQQQQQQIPLLLSESRTSLPFAAESLDEAGYHSPAAEAHALPRSSYFNAAAWCTSNRRAVEYPRRHPAAAFCCSNSPCSSITAGGCGMISSSHSSSPPHLACGTAGSGDEAAAAAAVRCGERGTKAREGASSWADSVLLHSFSSLEQQPISAATAREEASSADAAVCLLALAEAAAPALLQQQPTATCCNSSRVAIAADLGQRVIRLVWSCCWVCILLWLLLRLAIALYSDIVETEQQQQVQAAAAAARCRQQHRDNKCELLHPLPPYLQQPCAEWKACLMRQPQHHAARTKVAATVVGDVLNTFFRKLEWRTIASLAVLLAAGIYATALLSTNSSFICSAPFVSRHTSALAGARTNSPSAAAAAALLRKQLLLLLQQSPCVMMQQNATRCLPSAISKIEPHEPTTAGTAVPTAAPTATGEFSQQQQHYVYCGPGEAVLWPGNQSESEKFSAGLGDTRLKDSFDAAGAPLCAGQPCLETRRRRNFYAAPETAAARQTMGKVLYMQHPSTADTGVSASSAHRVQQREYHQWNKTLHRQQRPWHVPQQETEPTL